jgi:AAA+ superfamily predicted ATPase
MGMMVWGPAGTGKTKLVNSLLQTSPFPYIACNATELFRSDRGATEEEIKRLFARASERAPSILFIDEIDAICSNTARANGMCI